MAQKTIRDYSAPSANQVPTGPEVYTGGENFEIIVPVMLEIWSCFQKSKKASSPVIRNVLSEPYVIFHEIIENIRATIQA